MERRKIIPFAFYNRSVTGVAQELLGKFLVRVVDDQQIIGIINETEAYDGRQDLACHARVGKTKRNSVMFGSAGHAYVYFTYGMHWCLNVVTGEINYPAAVLIRSIIPVEGLFVIAHYRENVPTKNWTNGPAKLTQALQINKMQNGIDLTTEENNLWIEEGINIEENIVKTSPRIGITNTPEPWRSMPWHYFFNGNEINLQGEDS
jgi:DNA-3-methyladenine glycosylase